MTIKKKKGRPHHRNFEKNKSDDVVKRARLERYDFNVGMREKGEMAALLFREVEIEWQNERFQ